MSTVPVIARKLQIPGCMGQNRVPVRAPLPNPEGVWMRWQRDLVRVKTTQNFPKEVPVFVRRLDFLLRVPAGFVTPH